MPDDAKFCEVCGAKMLPAPGDPGYVEETGGDSNQTDGWPAAPQEPYGNTAGSQDPYSGGAGTQPPYGGYNDGGSPASPYDMPGGPQGPGRRPSGSGGGGIPKIAIIGGIAVLGAAAALFALRGGKPKDNNNTAVTTVAAENAKQSGSGASGSNGSGSSAGGSGFAQSNSGNGSADTQANGLSGKDQAELLDAGINAITGGVTAADAEMIKVPEGAEIKTDAMLTDLIGEYEGEIQMTVIEGFEKIDGLPSDFNTIRQNALQNPLDCTLEVEEDGDWQMEWTLVGPMNFYSHDYANPEEMTPEQIDALIITILNNGMYHAKMDMSGDDDKGGQASMKMDHIGAYCTKGDDRMVAGNFLMQANMYGSNIKIQGDFVVHKTTEDFLAKETEAYAQEPATKPEEEDDADGIIMEKETEADNGTSVTVTDSTSGTSSSGTVSSGSLGKKAEALAKKNDKKDSSQTESSTEEIGTVTGGKWIQIASVWFYEKDGELVKNSWIEDNGVYYYVDETGYMLENAYTPDGYFVGADGSYDPTAPQNQKDGGNYIEDTPAGEAMAAIAKKLSTDEPAYATEFDWLIDYVDYGGHSNGLVITDPSRATRIRDLQPALNGGWKAFMFTAKGAYGSDSERYFNANIEASGGKFNITMNWKYIVENGETVEETGSTTYRGTYDDLEGTATAMTDDSKVDFDEFYLSSDGKTEYAVGTFYWISGEVEKIGLMRSAR